MADDTVEVRLIATDELSPVLEQASQNVARAMGSIASATAAGAQAWRGMLGEIDGAEDTFVRDLISRRQSLSQSLLDMGSQLIESEIANDLKYFTHYLVLSALQLDTDKLAAQGGLLVHLLTESEKTAATTTGVAARTSATVAGAETGFIAQAASAIKSIAIDAAQTFAGIFAFLAPIMGPSAVGPAAAGEAAVFAVAGSIAAFDVGAWEIPQDMLGIVHAGETILPADFASGFRASASGAGGTGGDGASPLNVTFAPQVSALDARSVVALFNNPAIMRQLARNLQSYLAANPSVRGAY